MERALFEQVVHRIEALIQALERLPDPTAREAAKASAHSPGLRSHA